MNRLRPAAARLLETTERLLQALLMAAGVTLLAAGLLWYGSPGATGSGLAAYAPPPSAPPAATAGDPASPPVATQPTGSASPATTDFPGTASALPSPSPATTASPGPEASATATVGPSSEASPASVAVATRVVIPSLEIDLPIVSGDIAVPNQGPNHYPPCDVALYHTAFAQPGEDGTTYLYAHARDGMFLPLLTGSEQRNGAGLLGSLVEVYTDDDQRYIYAITQVKRHATDFSLAEDVPPGVSQLVLQTSEGPRGTVPKLQILAQLQSTLTADHVDAHPKARPRACYETP